MAATLNNSDFAQQIGCGVSMASRLRSGERLPSIRLMARIAVVYGVSMQDLADAHNAGGEAFSQLLRDRVFGDHAAV